MAGFVLVHGAFHTGACFDLVVAELGARGHVVTAPTLPGMGGTGTELRAATLVGWADFALQQCRSVREASGGPVILAGHSRGGLVLTAAAEKDPEAIDHLAYVCAIMLPVGVPRAGSPTLSQEPENPEALFRSVEGGAGIAVHGRKALPAFAQLCPPELRDHALSCLVTEPAGPLAEALNHTAERWGSVPRTYIECAEDRTIPLDQQRQMQAGSPGTAQVTIAADHSPFYCAPGALADALEALAGG